MRRRIERYRSEKVPTGASASYLIGCLIISQPVFFEPDAWIDQPKSWGSQTVQGKTYDLATGEGMALHEMSLMAARSSPHPARLAESTSNSDRYGATQLVRPRLGQGSFRIAVTLAYERACAVTTEHSLPVLEASHIRPYAEGGHHTVSNGLLLRRDIHSLFDLGYVTVNADDHRFEVSKRLKEEWENGRIYYDMRGRKIATPKREEDRPDRALLRWHNDHVFQA
jgi:putative restriction endonuclease